MNTFWLGTHKPVWLGRTDVPLFVSRVTLSLYKKMPRALGRWALDSGGFSEISKHGRWTVSPEQYVGEVRRYRDEVGNLEWAAIQDWMCEPFIVEKTGLSVVEHQRLTIQSYDTLSALAPEIPWTPVVQGFERDEYLRHVEMYSSRGYDLSKLPIVGIGSVCRRQGTKGAEDIVRELARGGLKVHGFGFKTLGLRKVHDALESADSMAWSFNARKNPGIPGHTHKSCANCMEYALQWREKMLAKLDLDRRGRLV